MDAPNGSSTGIAGLDCRGSREIAGSVLAWISVVAVAVARAPEVCVACTGCGFGRGSFGFASEIISRLALKGGICAGYTSGTTTKPPNAPACNTRETAPIHRTPLRRPPSTTLVSNMPHLALSIAKMCAQPARSAYPCLDTGFFHSVPALNTGLLSAKPWLKTLRPILMSYEWPGPTITGNRAALVPSDHGLQRFTRVDQQARTLRRTHHHHRGRLPLSRDVRDRRPCRQAARAPVQGWHQRPRRPRSPLRKRHRPARRPRPDEPVRLRAPHEARARR